MIPCNVTSSREKHKYPQLLNFKNVLIDLDRLWISYAFAISLESCSHCKVGQLLDADRFFRAIAVFVSEFLPVCVANLCKFCSSCYLLFVFSRNIPE
ncbi:hypothetical protein AVEN_78804-1 [Araneus ventricosus]|uniref:Uncharacterized protein n=1 Tax=Araneus ventricosus TaxID=182803 RepID=A0A4Y2HGD7_ARAVE|nr:hypothetical protein AVEN_78804-1 [Araneus ventricosus]